MEGKVLLLLEPAVHLSLPHSMQPSVQRVVRYSSCLERESNGWPSGIVISPLCSNINRNSLDSKALTLPFPVN